MTTHPNGWGELHREFAIIFRNMKRFARLVFVSIGQAACLFGTDVVEAEQLLADFKDIHECVWSDASRRCPFDVIGNAAFVCDGNGTRIDILSDRHLYQFWATNGCAHSLKGGRSVRIRGHVDRTINSIRTEFPMPNAAYVDEVIDLGPMAPLHFGRISGGRLVSGDFKNIAVSVEGVVSHVRKDELNPSWNWFVLRTPTGKVHVATPEREHPLAKLAALTDAEVLIHGIAARSGHLRSFLGFHLMPIGPESIVCTKPPPEDAFSIPPALPFLLKKLTIPNNKDSDILHRLRISGSVLGHGDGRIFVKTPENGFCAVLAEDDTSGIPPGSSITAAGFVEHGPCSLELVCAKIRVDRASRPPHVVRATPIDASRLFPAHDGRQPMDPEIYGEAIQITGTVANSHDSIRHDGFIRLACGVYTASIDIRDHLKSQREIPDLGFRLSVSGICFGGYSAGLADNGLPVFTGFTVYPRVPEDIVIMSRPSWWTPARLMGVILALTVLIVAILIWNRSLAVLSDRRGKRLYAEAIAHTKAEMKVEERTHLAVELHDAMSQTLTGVALQIDSARLANRGGNARVGQVLEVAKSMLSSCRKELHNCLWDLRSRTFEEKDMTEAVTRTLAPYSDDIDISVRFNVPRDIFEESQSHAILRMVRELAVNAINHGHASRLWIAGEHHDGTVSFSIRDNGCGFDPTAVPGPQQGHFGLQGIRERLEKLDGNLEIHSEPGGETKVCVRLRIQEQEHE